MALIIYNHVVAGQSFCVTEQTTYDGGMQTTRTLQNASTGEVFREWVSAPGTWLQPYDGVGMQTELEERFAPKQHGFAAVPPIPKLGDTDSRGFRCTGVAGNGAFNEPPVTTWEKYDDFSRRKTIEKRILGTVMSTYTEDEGPSLTNWGISNKVSYNYGINANGHTIQFHKQHSAPAAVQDHDKEHDMAQRQDFTFPYTGAEIADSLERQAAKLDAQQVAEPKVDRATLQLVYPSYDDTDLDDLIKTKDATRRQTNAKLEKEAAALRKEAIPYAKAGKGSFEIDLEDIEHFGLNDDEAPVKAKRKRRTKAEMEQAAEDTTAA